MVLTRVDKTMKKGSIGQYGNNLASAVAAIGSTETTLIIDVTPDALTANVTIPSTLSLEWAAGCVVTGAYTLTINGSLSAGNYQLFGSDVVLAGSPKIDHAYVEWGGAVGDGSTDDIAAINKINTWFPAIKWLAKTYAISAEMVHPDGALKWDGVPWVTEIKYTGTPGKMLNLSVISAGYAGSVSNIKFNLNDLATHGFYGASVGVLQSIKNIEFNNCYALNIPSGGFGWQIGDQTNTGIDTDAWNYKFRNCHARGSAGAIGWLIDATNAYNISWYDSSYGRKDGSNFMTTGIKTLRGSGFRVYNYFGDKLDSGTSWCIDHTGGSFAVFGMNTEDYRVGKFRSSGEGTAEVKLSDIQVNDTDGDNLTGIDTTLRTVLDNVILNTLSADRNITATNELVASNVTLGTNGTYTLSSPQLCTLEGFRIGPTANIVPNGDMETWTGGTTIPPTSWTAWAGGASITYSRDTTQDIIGQYTAQMDFASAGTSKVPGMYADVPVSHLRGQTIYVYSQGNSSGLSGASDTMRIYENDSILGQGGTGYSGTAWSNVHAIVLSATATFLRIYMGAFNMTGTVYVDNVFIAPASFAGKTYVLRQLGSNGSTVIN